LEDADPAGASEGPAEPWLEASADMSCREASSAEAGPSDKESTVYTSRDVRTPGRLSSEDVASSEMFMAYPAVDVNWVTTQRVLEPEGGVWVGVGGAKDAVQRAMSAVGCRMNGVEGGERRAAGSKRLSECED